LKIFVTSVLDIRLGVLYTDVSLIILDLFKNE